MSCDLSAARRRGALSAAVIVLVGAAACDINFFVCEPADPAALEALPETLAETGIDGDDVIEYQPQFELWSDGASKRRWLRLPPGETIDTSDPDSWDFPVGTSVWKEFSRDGLRVETRLLRRIGPGVRDWAAVSYTWNADETLATAEPSGRLQARGTPHNVPAAGECAGCHGGRKSWVLGVSAIQLSGDLGDLQEAGLLSDSIEVATEVPGSDVERAALGYLHANCGHCHNSSRPPRDETRCFDPKRGFDLWLTTDSIDAVQSTATYQTAIDGHVIAAGKPAESELIERVSQRGFIYQMPPLGSEEIDDEGVETLRRWIRQL